MKFRKYVAQSIEAEKFDGVTIPENVQFRLVSGNWEIYNELHESWIKIKVGDYYRTDIPNDHYPIDSKYMEENYYEIFD